MKTKCSYLNVMTVIRRSMPLEAERLMPEHKLLLAIVQQAVADLKDSDHRLSASLWFHGDGFEVICDYLELNPEGVRSILRDASFL